MGLPPNSVTSYHGFVPCTPQMHMEVKESLCGGNSVWVVPNVISGILIWRLFLFGVLRSTPQKEFVSLFRRGLNVKVDYHLSCTVRQRWIADHPSPRNERADHLLKGVWSTSSIPAAQDKLLVRPTCLTRCRGLACLL